MLMKVQESPKDTGGHEHDRLGYPAGPGQMGMAQARHFVPGASAFRLRHQGPGAARDFVPEGTGLPQQEGHSLDFARGRLSMTTGLNQMVESSLPGPGASVLSKASPAFARKLNAFSPQFLKDFSRSGVTVNGHTIGQNAGTGNLLQAEAGRLLKGPGLRGKPASGRRRDAVSGGLRGSPPLPAGDACPSARGVAWPSDTTTRFYLRLPPVRGALPQAGQAHASARASTARRSWGRVCRAVRPKRSRPSPWGTVG